MFDLYENKINKKYKILLMKLGIISRDEDCRFIF